MTDQIQTVELSALWDALTDPKNPLATVYEWTDECGVATGAKVIPLGSDHYLAVDDENGFQIVSSDDIDEDDLIPSDEYNEDQAIRDASDLSGWFAIVGVPGSNHHDFRWFPEDEKSEAFAYVQRGFDSTLAANPVLGIIETEVVKAEIAFDRTYRDGNRVYFQPMQTGSGFEPKRGHDD